MTQCYLSQIFGMEGVEKHSVGQKRPRWSRCGPKSNPIARAERLAAGVAAGANYEAYQRANNNNNKQKEL
jgi:hypothetical protein